MPGTSKSPEEALGELLQATEQQTAISHVRRLYPRLEQALQSGISYIKMSQALSQTGVRIAPNTLAHYVTRIRRETAQGKGRRNHQEPTGSEGVVTPRTTSSQSPTEPAAESPRPLAGVLDFTSNDTLQQTIDKNYFDAGSNDRIASALKRRKQPQ